VTTTTAYASTYTLHIFREPSLLQSSNIDGQAWLDLNTIENVDDRQAMQIQYLKWLYDHSLRVADTDANLGSSLSLGSDEDRESLYLAFGATGLPALTAGTTSSYVVSTWAETLIDDANAANAKTTLNIKTYNVVDYGVDDTGATDVSTVLSEIETLSSAGDVIEFQPGTYLLSSSVTFDHSISLKGNGAVIKSTGGGFQFSGSLSAVDANVTADVSVLDVNIPVDDATGFAAGDLVLIYPTSVNSDVNMIGASELHRLRGTATNELQLEGLIRWPHDVYDSGDPCNPDEEDSYSGYADPNVAVYQPIEVTIDGFVFEANDGDWDGLHFDYCRNLKVTNCTVKVEDTRDTQAYWIDFADCQNIDFSHNMFTTAADVNQIDTAEGKGPMWQRCEFVNVHHNTASNWNGSQFFRFYLCGQVQFNNNQVYDALVQLAYFDAVRGGTCSDNLIVGTPGRFAWRENKTTNQNGIFCNGVQDFVISGNHILNCNGEAAIYLRSGNYKRAQNMTSGWLDDQGDTWKDVYMAPNLGIVVANNAIRNDDPNAVRSWGLYSKSKGEDIVVTGNMIHVYAVGVGFYGDYNDLTIVGNDIESTGTTCLALSKAPSDDLWPENVFVTGNTIRHRTAIDVKPCFAQIYGDSDFVFTNNRIIKINAPGDTWLMSVARHATGAIGDSVVRIEDNTFEGDATSRGLSMSTNAFTGAPNTPGGFVVRNNVMDVVGQAYGTSLQPYVVEQVSTLDVNETDPNTYGLSKTFITANTGSTTIDNFVGGIEGQTIGVEINDAYTTLDFTSSNLKGRPADYNCTDGDFIWATYEGTNWHCVISPDYLQGSAVWDPPSIADGDEDVNDVTVTGAILGDFAVASFSIDVNDLNLSAAVGAANTVEVQLSNSTGGAIDLDSATVRVRVYKK